MDMQPGTEDIGSEDLTGRSTVTWHESMRAYVHPDTKPAKPTPEQRAALAAARQRLIAEGITSRIGVVTW